MIDHIGFIKSNYDISKAFCSKSLAPLGIELMLEVQDWTDFGPE